MQPCNEDELSDMIATGLALEAPAFIRYPRGNGNGTPIKQEPRLLEIGKAEVIEEGTDIALWAIGPMVKDAQTLKIMLSEHDISCTVVNARFIKPLDEQLLKAHAEKHHLIVTMEDHVRNGGFGSAILETLQDLGKEVPVLRIGWPDKFIDHGSSVDSLRSLNGLSHETLESQIIDRLRRVRGVAPIGKDKQSA